MEFFFQVSEETIPSAEMISKFQKWKIDRLIKVFTAWLRNTNWIFFRNQRLSKNATIDSVFQASSEPNNDKPSQPYFELYKTDFDTFNALHTYLCLWGGSEGDTSVMLGLIHNILQFTQFFRSRHNFKNWRLHEFTKVNDFCVVPLMKFKHN